MTPATDRLLAFRQRDRQPVRPSPPSPAPLSSDPLPSDVTEFRRSILGQTEVTCADAGSWN